MSQFTAALGAKPATQYRTTSKKTATSKKTTASLASAQASANKANEARYTQGLGTLQTSQADLNRLYGEAAALSEKIGASATTDANMGAERAISKANQAMMSKGLGATSLIGNVYRGAEEDRRRALERIDEQKAAAQIGIKTSQAGGQLGAAQAVANFIAAREDAGPDESLIAGLTSQAAGGAAPTPSYAMPSGSLAAALQPAASPTSSSQVSVVRNPYLEQQTQTPSSASIVTRAANGIRMGTPTSIKDQLLRIRQLYPGAASVITK
ncbi:MAG: hypothetical protein IT443_11905 [Phycisphaeraceae bacterium]|nr:hypothetical protein [Phycisphaeraceae bacterium]